MFITMQKKRKKMRFFLWDFNRRCEGEMRV